MKIISTCKGRLCFIISVILLFCAVTGVYDYMLPDSITVESMAGLNETLTIPFAQFPLKDEAMLAWNATKQDNACEEVKIQTNLFGVLPIRSVSVKQCERCSLIPGGMAFGVKIYTKGVLLVGMADIDSNGKHGNPAYDAGLRIRDIILAINGTEVNTVKEVTDILMNCEGKPLSFQVQREEAILEYQVTPTLCKDGIYKAGIWIRDCTAGIGTITYIDPDTLSFAGLGHGICDVDTGSLMPMNYGTVSGATITGIVPGKVGTPGELKGYFSSDKIGILTGNTPCGVFGTLNKLPETLGEAIPIGFKNEVHEGNAEIICTDANNEVKSYQVKITDVSHGSEETRNFVLQVTDASLLAATGGIVQGMSGSPVIQDGRLVGAVTHVLINDPTKGYGIFIENMLGKTPENISDTTDTAA